tara:strand:+ start:378 stop:662 length:285 start_codon:yes stop_codon:yes gene_type:complete
MNNIISTSDSVIGSLCREIKSIDNRSGIISTSINKSNNVKLIERLKKELKHLKARIYAIKNLAKTIELNGKPDNLSIELLNELIGRSLIHTTAL